jgi:hypothetical protein
MATIATISTAQSSLLMANTIASSMSFSPRKLAHEMREVFALFVIQYSSLDGGRQRGNHCIPPSTMQKIHCDIFSRPRFANRRRPAI